MQGNVNPVSAGALWLLPLLAGLVPALAWFWRVTRFNARLTSGYRS